MTAIAPVARLGFGASVDDGPPFGYVVVLLLLSNTETRELVVGMSRVTWPSGSFIVM